MTFHILSLQKETDQRPLADSLHALAQANYRFHHCLAPHTPPVVLVETGEHYDLVQKLLRLAPERLAAVFLIGQPENIPAHNSAGDSIPPNVPTLILTAETVATPTSSLLPHAEHHPLPTGCTPAHLAELLHAFCQLRVRSA